MRREQDVLMKIRAAQTYFPVQKGLFKRTVGYVRAVDNVSHDVYRGETMGLVGESGCGKTTLGKSILQLVPVTGGQFIYNIDGEEKDQRKLSKDEMMQARKRLQIDFQDTYSSLKPSLTILGSLQDQLNKFGVKSKEERRRIIGDLLEAVNLHREYMNRYPLEFCGGQR